MCLPDHVAQLRAALSELFEGEDVSVELAEATPERAAGVWTGERG